jgi:fimbrial isopeptide formation D2 family protein/LPXTG-motif cell wall-anchored protein
MAAPISAEDAKAFSDDSETKSIIVVDTTNSTTRNYDLYQIFGGTLKEGKLTYVSWGDSIVGSVTVDGVTTSYDFSTALVDALKAEKLATGEDNPLKDDFANITADGEVKELDDGTSKTTKYSARAVADIVATYQNKSEEIDAFATAVASVLDGQTVEYRTQGYSDLQISTGTEYIFQGVEDGYYLVNETTSPTITEKVKGEDGSEKEVTTKKTDFTYSKYMINVGTGENGTTIYAKGSAIPTLEKKIKYGTDDPDTAADESLHDYQSVAYNNKVEFQLTSAVPSMDGYSKYYFIMNDEMSAGLTFDKIKSVMVGDIKLKEAKEAKDNEPSYELDVVQDNDDEPTALTITFKNFIQYKDLEGAKITVNYTADVDEDIVIGDTNENTNTANLTYSNNPNYNYKGTTDDPDKPGEDEPTLDTVDDTVYVYTAGVSVFKTDANGVRLAGAEFKIKDVGTTVTSENGKVTSTPNSDKVITVVPKLTAICYDSQSTTFDTTSNGTPYYKMVSNAYSSQKYTDASMSRYAKEKVKYKKNDDGTYTPDVEGTYYKLASEDTYIEVGKETSDQVLEKDYVLYKYEEVVTEQTEDGDNEVVGTVSAENGMISFNGLNVGTYIITEEKAPAGYEKITDALTVTVTFDDTKAAIGEGKWSYSSVESESNKLVTAETSNKGIYEVEVKNLSETTLPSTGGMGTTIFYAAGSTLAAAAAVMLIVKRRMRKEEESL